MDVQFYGHNCFIVGNDKFQIVTDPWLTGNGAFYGSWYQWPINHHLLPDLIGKISRKKTYIYVSHEHQDHFDIETLRKLRPHCGTVLIPKYYDRFLHDTLEGIGYNVVELADSEEMLIGAGLSVRLLIVDTGVNHDSAALIKADGELFINQNDCKIYDRLKTIKEKVSVYAVQFSGATWHPVCYTYDEETKRNISRKKVNAKLIAVKKVIQDLKPDYFMPSAGPAVFPHLDPTLSLGEGTIFVHQPLLEKLIKGESTRLVCLRPGETFDRDVQTTPIPAPTREEVERLAQTLPNLWKEANPAFDPSRLRYALQQRLDQIGDLKFEKCPILILNWGSASKINGLAVDLNSATVRPVSDLPEDNYMLVTAERKYFALMSDKANRWQDIYISLRASVTRKPDLFSTFVNIFLFSDVSNIRKAFQTTLNISEERILKIDPNTGKSYEINRYCPHNGADLIDADIDGNGNLVCPRHAWLFKLANLGKCAETGASIKAAELENTITLCETISVRLTKPVDGTDIAAGQSRRN